MWKAYFALAFGLAIGAVAGPSVATRASSGAAGPTPVWTAGRQETPAARPLAIPGPRLAEAAAVRRLAQAAADPATSPGSAMPPASPSATATGRSRPTTSGGQRQTAGNSAVAGTAGNASSERYTDCVKLWDSGTHMSKQAWARTCRRIENRLQNLQVENLDVDSMGEKARKKRKSPDAG